MKKTKLIYGVGINDADYAAVQTINGSTVRCPFYRSWMKMLERCYSIRLHNRRPTYTGCTVTSEWLFFNNFRLWMQKQDWQGKSLDKDILIQHNKIYSPSTCIFVTNEINNILINRSNFRGLYPLGVCKYFDKRRHSNIRYMAQCSTYGKNKNLGLHDTPEEAHEAYKTFKYKHIAEVASQQSEPLRTALLNYVIEP